MIVTFMPAMAWAVDPEPTFVAKIGEKGYETLDAAFDEARNGETIEVLEDTTLACNQVIDKTLTLDLGGNTVTPAGDFTTAQNERFGILTVNGGNLTVKNGTIDSNNIGKTVIGVVGASEDKWMGHLPPEQQLWRRWQRL